MFAPTQNLPAEKNAKSPKLNMPQTYEISWKVLKKKSKANDITITPRKVIVAWPETYEKEFQILQFVAANLATAQLHFALQFSILYIFLIFRTENEILWHPTTLDWTWRDRLEQNIFVLFSDDVFRFLLSIVFCFYRVNQKMLLKSELLGSINFNKFQKSDKNAHLKYRFSCYDVGSKNF